MPYLSEDMFDIRGELTTDENPKSFFEIDELMIPIIQVLNLKGYKTFACCSGHPYEEIEDSNSVCVCPYVMFAPGIVLPSYPKNAHLELENLCDSQFRFTIRHFEVVKNAGDYYRICNKILNIMKVWHEWARSLPPYNKEESIQSFIKLL